MNETLANATEYGKQALTYATESLKEVTTQYLQENANKTGPKTGGGLIGNNDSDGLSGGEIAAIVGGVLVGGVLVGGAVYKGYQYVTSPNQPPQMMLRHNLAGATGNPEAAREMMEPSEKNRHTLH